ncbi:S-adenosyl-L-methionine-dependent methyltransferase [Phyllosticta citribraziliensis]|uniref:S-adenosyl-L-methionine-dependent methyltransferase n=1 Tax=Phyllosticta citribraziliensis TaxID=989973 RepID=A0ABR1L3X2_9PEZI
MTQTTGPSQHTGNRHCRENMANNLLEADSSSSREENWESNTESVRDDIYDYIRENGRTYHRHAAGSYLYPNDEPERERLELQHELLKILFGMRNYFAPLQNPRKILDVGTGTGKWAVEMANEFPDCEVTGTDLSPIQPEWVPENVQFIIDDAAEDDWLIQPDTYDYIHTRLLLGCFEDFRDVIRKSYRYLKPGGWMESQEVYPTLYCDDGTMSDDFPFMEWTRTQDSAAMNIGRPLRIANKLKRWYEQQGFVDIHEEVFKLPINPWPKDPQLKMLGRFNENGLLEGLQAFTLAWFHRGLGWTKEEIEVYLVQVRKAISDRNVHAYHKMYVVWGRKPQSWELGAETVAAAADSNAPRA